MTVLLGNTDAALRRCWHPVALATEVGDAPLPVRLVGSEWVLLRLDGRLTLLRDQCPHRLAPLHAGRVVDATLECAYHGYRFDADGVCVRIPSQAPSVPIGRKASCPTASRVVERYGIVWASIDSPVTELPSIPEYGADGFDVVMLPPQVWSAGAAQMTDNFLDLSHVPFVHAGSFADPSATAVNDAEITRSGWGFEAVTRNTAKRLRDVLDHSAGFETVERLNQFRYTAPFSVYLRLDVPDGTTLVLLFFCQPMDNGSTRLYTLNVRNDLGPGRTTAEEAVKLGEVVLAEDRWMLEQYPHTTMPLDLSVEHHTRADRVSVEMRRVLAELVRTAAA